MGRRVALAAGVALVVGLGACGSSDEDGGGDSAADAKAAAVETDTSSDDALGFDAGIPDPDSVDRSIPDPSRVEYQPNDFDRGSLEERKEVLAAYLAVQKDFFAGKGEAVCSTFDPEGYRRGFVVPPDCPKQVERVARQVSTGELRWPRYDVEWVRIYHNAGTFEATGGVTVVSDKKRIRMGFAKQDGRWLSVFEVPDELEGLNARGGN